jgi:hypothetical protein
MICYPSHRYFTPKWQARIIPDDKKFHFYLGPTVSSLFELKQALTMVDDASFTAHVNSEKNDIANWVEFVINDHDLATVLRPQTHRWGLIVALERQMMRTLNLPPYVAQRWLSKASNSLTFVSQEMVDSLDSLASVLEKTSDNTVEYHLQRVPNDISQWVLSNIGDYLLAELLEEASNRTQMHQFVSDHLVMLKDAADNS